MFLKSHRTKSNLCDKFFIVLHNMRLFDQKSEHRCSKADFYCQSVELSENSNHIDHTCTFMFMYNFHQMQRTTKVKLAESGLYIPLIL